MEQLGIRTGLLITQVINFAIVLYILQRFLYKPILSLIDKRKKEIEEGLTLQENMKHESEKLDIQKKKILKDANEEGQRLIAAAIIEAKKVEERIVKSAKEEVLEIKERAKASVARERDQMIDQARKRSLSYAILISEKLLSMKLTKDEQERLLKEAVKRLEESYTYGER